MVTLSNLNRDRLAIVFIVSLVIMFLLFFATIYSAEGSISFMILKNYSDYIAFASFRIVILALATTILAIVVNDRSRLANVLFGVLISSIVAVVYVQLA